MLGRGERPRRDVLPGHRLVHLLQVDPDLVTPCEAVEGEASRVGDIESHPAPVRPRQPRFPGRADRERQRRRVCPEDPPEKLAQTSAPHDEIVTVPMPPEPVGPRPFLGREQLLEPGRFETVHVQATRHDLDHLPRQARGPRPART
jgi:hypothetical protein